MQILLAAFSLLGIGSAAAASSARLLQRNNPAFPPPSQDPFYKVPGDIGRYQNGDVIARRFVPTVLHGQPLGAAFQLLYATTNSWGQRDATVNTILIPQNPAWPPVILAYQDHEDATSADCAPSWGLVDNSGSTTPVTQTSDQQTYFKWALVSARQSRSSQV